MDAYTDRRKQSAPQELLTHREARLIVLGVLLPTFMGSLDQTVLANALPTIGRDLGDLHNLPWLITAYLLASTAVIPLYGKVADIHGRHFTLRIAILTYMAGSLVCALALLWHILSGMGFPNHFFCDSWVVGFWRGRPWRVGPWIGEQSLDSFSSHFWIGWVTKRGEKCVRSTCRD